MKAFGKISMSLTAMVLAVVGTSYLLFDFFGLFLGLLVSLGVITYIALRADQQIIDEFALKEIKGTHPRHLRRLVNQYSHMAEIPAPQIFISNQPYAQAFTFGRPFASAKLVVFNSLIDKLSEAELKTLVAHLIAQVKLKSQASHSVSSLFTQAVLTITQSLDGIFRFLTGVKESKTLRRSRPFTLLAAPILSLSIRLFQSGSNIYSADLMTSDWIGSKQRVSRLLSKMSSYSKQNHHIPPLKYGHIFLTSPLTSLRWGRYLSWQPDVKMRTTELVGHYPA